jgi:anti-sigma factor RsiW
MKACTRNKKRITWLVAGALNAELGQQLQTHFQTCPGCRQYFQEISGIFQEPALAARTLPPVQASNSFHEQLDDRILASVPDSAPSWVIEQLRHWSSPWRMAAATCVVTLLVLVVVLRFPSPHRDPVLVQVSTPRPNPIPVQTDDSEPTLCRYWMAANTSLEALNELLADHAARILAPTEAYTDFGTDNN